MVLARRPRFRCPVCGKGFSNLTYMRYKHICKAHPLQEKQPPVYPTPDAFTIQAFTSALVGEILSKLSPSRKKVGEATVKLYAAENVFAHVFGAHSEYSLSRREYVCRFVGVAGRDTFQSLLGVPGDLETISGRGVRTFLKAGANGAECVIFVRWKEKVSFTPRRGDHLMVTNRSCSCTFERMRRWINSITAICCLSGCSSVPLPGRFLPLRPSWLSSLFLRSLH